MIRSMLPTDAPEVLALLEWMDDQPERETFAPDARTVEDLLLENSGRDKFCAVAVDDLGQIDGYCGLAEVHLESGEVGRVVEGPIGAASVPLLRAVLRDTPGDVYAFCARDNLETREALEAAGFAAMHTTDFYRLRRDRFAASRVPRPEGRFRPEIDQDTYRRLYRASEDGWSGRLGWSHAEFRTHFAREDVRLLVLDDGGPVGFAELELGESAQLTYLAVHPAERGRGFGAALLRAALHEAFAHPEVREVRARAHDHERSARRLYHAHGFDTCRSVVTYLRADEE